MQEAGESGVTRSKQSAVSPLLVFVGLMAVLITVGAVVLLTREPPAPPPPTTVAPETNFALTDTEAIARFKELHSVLLQAYADRDVTLLSSFLTPDSPLRQRAEKEIGQLLDDHVLDRAEIELISTRVTENTGESITVRQKSVERPHFVSEAGKDVSASRKPLLQVVDWTMRPDASVWKLFDSDVIRTSSLGGDDDG